MNRVDEKSLHFNKRIKVNFEGGDLTSDAGLLLYKKFDEKIALSRMIKETEVLNDPVLHHTHTNEEVITQKIYQYVLDTIEMTMRMN